MKYYQKNLHQFVDTLSEKEKEAVKKLSEQFLKQHDYFSEVWKYLGPSQKEKFLDIVAGGKSLISHKKIVYQCSFFLVLENGTFLKKQNFFVS